MTDVEKFSFIEFCSPLCMHFGTFQLTDEGIGDPLRDLAKAKKETNIENFITLEEGKSRLLNF